MGINHRRAVFLDRDGVINRVVQQDGKPHPPSDTDQVEILQGVAAALSDLKAAGYLLIVVTNQPDVARGTQTQAAVEAIHTHLAARLPIDEFRTCYHDDGDSCDCRKPKPGLLVDSALAHDVDLSASVMVGDRWRDIEAGRAAGCRTIFVNCEYNERQPVNPDAVVRSLEEAAQWILSHAGRPHEDC